MKETLKRFYCDNCKRQVTQLESKGYPYDLGWTYIYKLSGKILNDKMIKYYRIKDSHFCSIECQSKYILKEINKSKGENEECQTK